MHALNAVIRTAADKNQNELEKVTAAQQTAHGSDMGPFMNFSQVKGSYNRQGLEKQT
jgi:hypothetical protein